MKIDIVVLNYNGEKLLPLCLPSIIEAKKYSQHEVDILVIDNESTDNSLKVLETFGKSIQVILHQNLVFCSFNEVVKRLQSQIVILLNNDIKVEKNFIDPLVEVFIKNRTVFLAAPKVLNFDNQKQGAFTKAKIKLGLFRSSAIFNGWQDQVENFSYTFSSGFGAFSREKFIELGGYDELYLPGRFEDADLGLRAWRKGWESYYQPKSIVYHLGQVAFKERFGKKGIDLIDAQNIFLFMWKNSNLSLLAKHLLFLPLWFVWWMINKKFYYFHGVINALKKIKTILIKRKKEKKTKYQFKIEEACYLSQKGGGSYFESKAQPVRASHGEMRSPSL